MLKPTDQTTAIREWLVALTVVTVTLGIGSTASAQDETDSSGSASSSETASSDEQGGPSEGGDSEAEEVEPEDKPEPGDPQYWSKVRKIHTVQKREFQKVNRFGISVYGGIIPNNIFERYFPVGLRLDYFILENIGIELAGSYNFQAPTSLESVMSNSKGINTTERGVTIADTQLNHTNFGIIWSPFYGKTAFNDSSIGYFDLYIMGGAGMVVTQTPNEQRELQTNIKPEGVLGAGVAFYFADHIVARADFRQFIFQKVASVGGIANPSEVSLGVGWFF